MHPFFRTTFLLALSVILAGLAHGQTPTTTIQNGNADTRLQLNYDGGLLVPGTFGPTTPADSIPATGAGTRLMWYPAKAAFRAGRVFDNTFSGTGVDGRTFWNPANVGNYSVAFGNNTKASGTVSLAAGINTVASAPNATALGAGTEASGEAALATGNNTTASGTGATAMGKATTASGSAATAVGEETTASGLNATAMGLRTTASGGAATAMGNRTAASGGAATAMGVETTAASDRSLSIGVLNSANTSDDNTLFVAGNGSPLAPSDALVLDFSGNLEISGTLTESSDRRLKTDIEPLDEGVLPALQEVRPVHYRFKNQSTHPSGKQVGLLAQEVRKAFPALVSEGSGGYLSLSYSKLTAVLLKGLQEQQAHLKTQRSAIDSLRDQVQAVEALRAENETMKERLAALEADRSPSAVAGWSDSSAGLLLSLLIGGLFGAGLLWRRRH